MGEELSKDPAGCCIAIVDPIDRKNALFVLDGL
jgi:hypothetical protein